MWGKLPSLPRDGRIFQAVHLIAAGELYREDWRPQRRRIPTRAWQAD